MIGFQQLAMECRKKKKKKTLPSQKRTLFVSSNRERGDEGMCDVDADDTRPG
jgi:hypothetical protein